MTTDSREGDQRSGDAGPGRATQVYVELEGGLLAASALWESIASVARTRPWVLLALPLWGLMARGPRPGASLFAQLQEKWPLDPETLPYRENVLDHLRAARDRGASLVLVSRELGGFAERVSATLGIFDGVVAGDGRKPLEGAAAAQALRNSGAREGFEWIGGSEPEPDIAAAAGTVVLAAAERGTEPEASGSRRVLGTRPSVIAAAVRAMRPRQWAKNLLLWIPLILAHRAINDPDRTVATGLAFAGFCLIASATYLLNDFLDTAADRQHPTKRHRPFASGALPVSLGLALMAALVVGGFTMSAMLLSPLSTGMLAIYFTLTTAYTFFFKERLFLDVLVLAGLYTHRVLAGGVAANVPISPWLLGFSMFFFLSLALVKRYAELRSARERGLDQLDRRGYEVEDLGLVESMGLTSGYVSVLVIGLYVSGPDVSVLYQTPETLWLICPVLLYWITRVWFLARRGQMPDDPVLFATRDPVSYLAGGLIAILGALAAIQW